MAANDIVAVDAIGKPITAATPPRASVPKAASAPAIPIKPDAS